MDECLIALDALSQKLVPYLFPFFIEFFLMCAATMNKIVLQVGFPACALSKEKQKQGIHWRRVLHRANQLLPSIIIGCLVVGCTIVATVAFIYLNEQPSRESTEIAEHIFFSTDIILNTLEIFIFAYGFKFLIKFPFSNHLDSVLDQSLVIAALGGLLLLLGFEILPSIDGLGYEGFLGEIAKLGVTSNFLTYVEAIIQFLFIMDGLRRERATKICKETSGPSVIVAGIYINLCLWILSSFVVKQTSGNPLLQEFYGVLTWNIALYVCSPLAVFFRFHCCVVLTDIYEDLWV